MTTNQTRGMASIAALHELWQLLLAQMTARLAAKRPSIDLLCCARTFLSNCRYIGPVDSPKVRKQLDKLHAAYVAGLIAGMASAAPSAGLLGEVRIFMDEAKRQQEVIAASAGHPSIPGGVPFNTTPH